MVTIYRLWVQDIPDISRKPMTHSANKSIPRESEEDTDSLAATDKTVMKAIYNQNSDHKNSYQVDFSPPSIKLFFHLHLTSSFEGKQLFNFKILIRML